MVTKSISAETAIINLHPNYRGRRGQIASGNIRLAPCAERLPFCITIMSITPTAAALTKSATIPFCMKVRRRYRSVCVNPFRQARFQAYALSRSNAHYGFLSRQEFLSEIVNGKNTVCIDSSYAINITSSSWENSSASSYCSGNQAIGDATFKEKVLFVTMDTRDCHVILSCDKSGNLS